MTDRDYRGQSGFKIFLSYFKPHRKLFALDMGCAFAVAAIDLAYPVLSRYALNDLLPQKAYAPFFGLIAAILFAYALRALLQYVITFWGHTFGIRVEADIRRDLFEHLQALSFDFYDKNRTARLMSRLTTDLFELTELSHHGPEDLFISFVTIVGALIVMFRMEWRLALIVAVILPIAVWLVMRGRNNMMRTSREVKEKQAGINAAIESGLSGVRVAKAFANEEQEIDKFNSANARYRVSKRDFYHVMGQFVATVEFFVTILSVVVIGMGGYFIIRGRMNYADLIAFTLYVTAFTAPIRKLANFSEIFASGTAGLNRFLEIMRTEPDLKDAPDAKALGVVKGDIAFHDVSFSYNDRREVLHEVSLHIRPGEKIGVVGSSGGGKSTLCQLIPRFYDVSGGSITIDGYDLRAVTQKSLRQNIGIVEQDVFLFADSIRENIRYGRPGASDQEVEEAAKRAEIYYDVMLMDKGFDTWVGERGVLLSGGQKQRIAIARIFLKNPPVLILDEATSALDSVTEEKIQRSLDELAKGRTTVMIAHRLSTIRSADRILVIEGGRIREEGTHEELMRKNGEYATLSRTQNTIACEERGKLV